MQTPALAVQPSGVVQVEVVVQAQVDPGDIRGIVFNPGTTQDVLLRLLGGLRREHPPPKTHETQTVLFFRCLFVRTRDPVRTHFAHPGNLLGSTWIHD